MNSHDREVQKLYEEMEQQIKAVRDRYETEVIDTLYSQWPHTQAIFPHFHRSGSRLLPPFAHRNTILSRIRLGCGVVSVMRSSQILKLVVHL